MGILRSGGLALALAAGLWTAPGALAGVIFRTDTPVAPSTAANPLSLDIYNNAGNAITVNVTNILPTDTAAQKATKIKNAINTQSGFQAVSLGAEISVGGTGKVRLKSDPTKERLDAIKGDFAYAGLFGATTTSVCTGLTPLGTPSQVMMGIDGLYVSSVTPISGQSAASILNSLATDLSSHGIPAMFDSANSQVVLTSSMSTQQTFVFGNTDSGLASFAEVSLVPSPGAFAVLAGLGVPIARRRRL